MIYMQVEDVEQLFSELDKLEQNNWTSDNAEEKKLRKPLKKKVIVKKPCKSKAPSNLRQMLMNKRKELKENADSKNQDQMIVDKPIDESETVAFEAGFFKVLTPMKSPKIEPAQRYKNSSFIFSNVELNDILLQGAIS